MRDYPLKVYGAWAGNSKGQPYDPERCAYAVRYDPRSPTKFQCSRKRGHGPDGLFCKQHAEIIEASS